MKKKKHKPQIIDPTYSIVIVGAGPYGLSLASHLQYAGVNIKVFGDPMSFWENNVAKGGHMRSTLTGVTIADPTGSFSLGAYARETKTKLVYPLPIDDFVHYGKWFERLAVGGVDRRKVISITQTPYGFMLVLDDATRVTAKRVIIATGIEKTAWKPSLFTQIPEKLASHTSSHKDFSIFKNQHVTVIGAGQSAIESATILHTSGAKVEVLVRASDITWKNYSDPPKNYLETVIQFLQTTVVKHPRIFPFIPMLIKKSVYQIQPSVAKWNKSKIEGITFSFGVSVKKVNKRGDKLELLLSDTTRRLTDHVLLGTGFQFTMSQYTFFDEKMINNIQTTNGLPKLTKGFESSIKGLHFIGKAATGSYGPVFGFINGTAYTSQHMLAYLRQHA